MRVAIIPPTSLLELTTPLGFHLILAHLCEADLRYAMYYKHRREQGDWIILDNGAYELGAAVSETVMEKWAAAIKPQEIVLPDVLKDRRATIERSTQTLRRWRKLFPASRLVAVPQGSTLDEYLACWRSFIEMPGISTIGVFIRATEFMGERDRLNLLREIELRGFHLYHQIHLLGTDKYFQEVQHVPRMYPWVRSTDSAKPITAAMCGYLLEELAQLKTQTYGRPAGYFGATFNSIDDLFYIKHNMNRFASWASGQDKKVVH